MQGQRIRGWNGEFWGCIEVVMGRLEEEATSHHTNQVREEPLCPTIHQIYLTNVFHLYMTVSPFN